MMALNLYALTNVGLISLESLIWSQAVLRESDLVERAEQLERLSAEESRMLLILLDFLTTERRVPVDGSLDSLWQAASVAELTYHHGIKLTAWSARDCQILLRRLSKKVDAASDCQNIPVAYGIQDETASEIMGKAYHKFVNRLESISRQSDLWLVMLESRDDVHN